MPSRAPTTLLVRAVIILLVGVLPLSRIHTQTSGGGSSSSALGALFGDGMFYQPPPKPTHKNKDDDTTPQHRHTHSAVSCPKIMARRQDEDFYDPNKALAESPKRLTITEPQFWISLFIEWFDQMRWVSIYNKGEYYEKGLTKIFKDVLSGDGDGNGVGNSGNGNGTHVTAVSGRVIDVGMNVGWFTLFSRALGHQVSSFDPNPIMSVRVCESLQLNGWDQDGSVRIFPYGVGSEEKAMNLTTGKNPGGSSFFAERLAKKFRKAIPAKVVRLDDVAIQEGWLEDTAPPIRLMKVDVEGFEYFSFLGAKRILSSGKVENIIMENSITEPLQIVSLLALIYQNGYKIHALLSVNGDPYHNDERTLAMVNRDLSETVGRTNSTDLGDSNFLIKITNNIWWKKR